jgi:GNAT superfamily N-acetyltransferase
MRMAQDALVYSRQHTFNMKLTFSIATDADAGAIAALRNAAAEHLTHRYGQGHWSSTSTERGVLRDLSRPKFSRTLVARDGPTIIATLCLQTKKPWAIDVAYFTNVKKALYLINMAVHPDRQGKGVGRLILKEAEAHARAWPGDAIRLDAWNGDAGAGPFYAKCGFRETGRVVYRQSPLVYYEMVL